MPTGSTALTKSIWFIRNNWISSAHAFSRHRNEQHTTMSESINITAVLLPAVHTLTAALPYSPRSRMIADPNWSSVLPLLVEMMEEAQTVARDRELVGTWHTTDIASLRPGNALVWMPSQPKTTKRLLEMLSHESHSRRLHSPSSRVDW